MLRRRTVSQHNKLRIGQLESRTPIGKQDHKREARVYRRGGGVHQYNRKGQAGD